MHVAPLQLAGCYRISLQLAVENGLKHIVSFSREREREKASRRRLLTFPFFFLSFRSDVELSFFFSFIQAFPAISTGIYGYPVESATRVAFEEVRKFLDTGEAKEASLVYV